MLLAQLGALERLQPVQQQTGLQRDAKIVLRLCFFLAVHDRVVDRNLTVEIDDFNCSSRLQRKRRVIARI